MGTLGLDGGLTRPVSARDPVSSGIASTAIHSCNNAYAGRLIVNVRRAGLHTVTNPLDNAVLQGRFDHYPRLVHGLQPTSVVGLVAVAAIALGLGALRFVRKDIGV